MRPRKEITDEWLPQRFTRIVIGIAIVVGLALRLIGLSYPPYDSHAYRQTQTLSTIEAFHSQGIDLFHPKTIYMGYPGTFVLELPVFQALAALLYGFFGPHLEIVRIINILFGAGTAWLLYRITRHLVDRVTAVLAFWIYWLGPLNILYQRSMLLDPMAVFCAMGSFYCLAMLLEPGDPLARLRGARGDWLRFAVFAVATWFTVMMKALYLWPTVLLFCQAVIVRRFKLDLRITGIIAVFVAAGGCFLAWNNYAGKVNSASPFTTAIYGVAGGLKPTSQLGFSALISPVYYYFQLLIRPKWWLGVLGVLLYPVGAMAAWKGTGERARTAVLWLLILVPPTYLLLFANINLPHDFYQLIITPFLAIVSGYGLRWLGMRATARFPKFGSARDATLAGAGVVLVVVAVLTYCVWIRAPRVDAPNLKFQQLCAGKFDPGAQAMIFVTPSVSGGPRTSNLPSYLYAARLWGYGKIVKNDEEARPQFEQLAPAFPRLEYVVFYGTEQPKWLPESFHLRIQDDNQRFYVFQRVPSD